MGRDSDPAKTPAEAEEQRAEATEGAETEHDAPREEEKGRKHDKKKRARQVYIGEDRLRELEEKSKKADEYYGHYVRAIADIDNLRKRTQRDKEDFVKYANERLLSEVIPILDNFERAFTAGEEVPATHNFAVGVEMILKQLREVLARYGVEELHPEGEPFDPAKHEAAEPVQTTEHPDNTVLEVLQRGYMLNGRVVQPAVVRVAVNPTPAEANEAPDDENDSSSSENESHTDMKEVQKDGEDHRN
jgi:molecular chaperone GrpE